MRVLAVEDEPKMSNLLQRGLRDEGIAADISDSGEDALWMSGRIAYDVIVLDVMLPGLDGLETCRRLRAAGISVPVLMLSARGTVEDRVAGLATGADDYLAEPFSFSELTARVRALGRRGGRGKQAVGDHDSGSEHQIRSSTESSTGSCSDHTLPGMGEAAIVEAKQGRTWT